MDVIGQYCIVPKHLTYKGRKRRRAFHQGGADDEKLMQELATKYAAENQEDYLIVQVVAEVSRPVKESKQPA